LKEPEKQDLRASPKDAAQAKSLTLSLMISTP